MESSLEHFGCRGARLFVWRRPDPSDCSLQLGCLAPPSSASHFSAGPFWSSSGEQSVASVNSVRAELRLAAAVIVFFAFYGTRRSTDELVCSTDASMGEGEDSIKRHGGQHRVDD